MSFLGKLGGLFTSNSQVPITEQNTLADFFEKINASEAEKTNSARPTADEELEALLLTVHSEQSAIVKELWRNENFMAARWTWLAHELALRAVFYRYKYFGNWPDITTILEDVALVSYVYGHERLVDDTAADGIESLRFWQSMLSKFAVSRGAFVPDFSTRALDARFRGAEDTAFGYYVCLHPNYAAILDAYREADLSKAYELAAKAISEAQVANDEMMFACRLTAMIVLVQRSALPDDFVTSVRTLCTGKSTETVALLEVAMGNMTLKEYYAANANLADKRAYFWRGAYLAATARRQDALPLFRSAIEGRRADPETLAGLIELGLPYHDLRS
jgi:hypothetical protein